ncbi:MAG: hypothetical protein PHU14_10750 [Methylovulum sp.]|nr:hypothetical protein [Methylovulum sp.]
MNKIMSVFLLIFLGTALSPAQAEEVFKCIIDYKTVYQTDPCPATAIKTEEIEIKQKDPAKEAEAQAKLKAWEDDFNKREATEKKAQQERQAELDRQAAINALNRNAKAEEDFAAAQRQRNEFNHSFYGYGYNPPYNAAPGGYYFDGFNYPWHPRHEWQRPHVVRPQPQPEYRGRLAR